MASHFLLSAKARTLSLATVLRMTDEAAETMFASIRWADTAGEAVCPHCACPTCYKARRPSGALRFRCKACRKDFSLTSGTLFAFHKLPLQTYLAAIVIFCTLSLEELVAIAREAGARWEGWRAAVTDEDRAALKERLAVTSETHEIVRVPFPKWERFVINNITYVYMGNDQIICFYPN